MGVIVIRFPDGDKEFRYPDPELVEGDVVWHDGERYRVIHITADGGGARNVTVELDSDDLGELLSSERGGIQLVPVD
jgi:hypothetical protein